MQGDNPQPGRSNYLDFELEIGQGSGREYPVAVLHSPAGEVRATMRFPFDELALDLRLGKLQIALLRSGGKHRRAPSEEERGVQDFGQALFDALLGGEIRSCYDVSLREAAQQGKGLRLKLRIHPPELSALPWEFLYDPRQAEYVCLSRQTPIVRYLESPRLIQPLRVAPPLRILGMVASPQDLPALDLERERERVERAVHSLRARGLVELEWLPGQTWRDLQAATWGGPWHVFHFIGHGGFDTNADEGFIALADSEGRTNCLSATRLGRLLADHTPLRLVLLNSCEGAKGSDLDVFSSVASILVRRGIPAVLAMQYEITDRAAVELACAFYEALAYGMAVDEAVVVARKAISLAVTNTVEWGTPVLYMRTPDGVLFQMTEMPRVPPPPPESPKPPSEAEEERERRLEQLYTAGLSAFWLEEWDKASRHFDTIVESRPDYRDAADKLAEAQHQLRWNDLYTQAQAAREAGDWQRALAVLGELAAEKPDYRDATALLELTQRQKRMADHYAEARHLYRAGQWQAVVNVFVQISTLDPDHPDPEGLLPAAKHELSEQKRRAALNDLYSQALREMNAGRWEEARQLLHQVQAQEPDYVETKRLLVRAESEIEREQRERVERQRQEQIARLYEEAQGLARVGQWRQALAKLDQVRTVDPQFPDPKGIAAQAQAEVAREEEEARRQKELAALYAEAVRLLRAGQYQAALDKWDQVRAQDPQYPDRDKVQATAGQKLAAPVKAAPPQHDTPKAVQPRRAPLPAWFGPAAGAAGVLLVIVVVVIVALGGAGGGKATPTDTPRPTVPVTVMVYVPAGTFTMGSDDSDPDATEDEKPQHTVYLDAFWIDRTEVTNAQYRRCVDDGACRSPSKTSSDTHDSYYGASKFDDYPVIWVDWEQANAYCTWAGKRLPTEAEWEKAARGTDRRIYPWGEGIDCNHANYGGCAGDTAQVASYPQGASPYGVLDMAGNVWEWVADWYAEDYYANSPDRNPQGPGSGERRVLRGGSWLGDERVVRAALRSSGGPSLARGDLGFRCARSGSGP
jgi:formylglycine-generating enzyme required for sulfatase activity